MQLLPKVTSFQVPMAPTRVREKVAEELHDDDGDGDGDVGRPSRFPSLH